MNITREELIELLGNHMADRTITKIIRDLDNKLKQKNIVSNNLRAMFKSLK